MHESLLHFLWKHQLISPSGLSTAQGQAVQVFRSGHANHHAGPDFLESRVNIDGLEWNGAVEIHLRSSDWVRHRHSQDPAYETVVLHVVWEHDQDLTRADGSLMPVLELRQRVDPALVQRCLQLINHLEAIPCQRQIGMVKEITILSTLDKMALERLERKARSLVLPMQERCQGDWEETAYADPRFELLLLCRKVCANREQADFIWQYYSNQINICLTHDDGYDVIQLGSITPWLKLEAIHSITT
ncbi:MAG: DUF2851 family protein, partial [Cytophagales bacterium]|nr:DUF2851 family protein [Cytophagales bacterium]